MRFLLLAALFLAPFCLESSMRSRSDPPKTTAKDPEWKKEVDEIDEQIRKLVNQRNLHLSRATRYQNQGDRLQFNHQNLIDARMAWQQAEINREIAARLQQEIELLEQKRQKILDRHHVKNYPDSPAKEKKTTK